MNAIANTAARKTLTAVKKVAPEVVADLGPFRFPKRSDFFFDFPRGSDFGVAASGKKANAEGVAKSWSNENVRAARLVRHSVVVAFDGSKSEHKSVAAAFRALRLPFEKHIKFRLALKASGAESFVHDDKMYLFALVAE